MSLKIVVLAKQVPDTRCVGKDAMNADGTINRAALPAIFNPEDLNALEQALRLKDTHPGSTVTILTMGPGRAAEIIREGLYRGADNGYLLTDRAFAGADTLATSYALATAVRKIGDYDIIVGGRQAIDGDTAQVGPQVAEKLGLPQITYVEEIENQRTLRHETKNEFLAIRSKICDKEKEKTIIDYIDEILGDTYSVKNEKYAKFGYLPANGVKGLCYFKTQKAEEQGISVSINISKKIQSSTICNLNTKEQRDFAKILGVFIDNAIEASAESKDKELGIEAYSNLDNEFRMIISNTYNNEIDEEKIGKENFTTKGKNRGHGLLLVNQLVKKNNIFDTKREIKNNIYSQTIIVKNRQK